MGQPNETFAPPLLVCLHFLGGSARGWRALAHRVGANFYPLPIDLPGFGDAREVPGYDVASMADHVAALVRARGPRRWVIAGHSMGAKVALALARRAEDGEAGLGGLSGIVTLAGSPPAPEPMEDEQRTEMLSWFTGSERARRRDADRFLAQNMVTKPDRETHAALLDDLLRMDRTAWVAWLEAGSREDWAGRVGLLRTPALVVGGREDGALGPDAQAKLMLPHFAYAEQVTLPGGAHLLPMEQPDRVARLVTDMFAEPPPVPEPYQLLIDSGRVSSRTRAAIAERAGRVDRAAMPALFSPVQRGTLRALAGRIIPQDGRGRIDLSARLEAGLAGSGDGWRPAVLPPDLAAWRAGLDTLEAQHEGFAGLDEAAQDRMLDAMAAGKVSGSLDGAQMKAWFEDVRSEAVRLTVSHPVFMARMGYSGIGYGGDGRDLPGFKLLAAGRREMWEPVAR